MEKFDVDGVLKDFQSGEVAERNDLMLAFTNAFRDLRRMRQFSVEVAEECLKQNHNPVTAISMALCYGMTLGVLMERKEIRKRRAN